MTVFRHQIKYELDNQSIFEVIKNSLITTLLIFKQLLISRKTLHYSCKAAEKIFVTEYKYLYKKDVLERVLDTDYNILSIEKPENFSNDLVTYNFQQKPFIFLREMLQLYSSQKIKVSSILAVCRSCIKYSFIYDPLYQSFLSKLSANNVSFYSSDPSNPFVLFLTDRYPEKSKFICTTQIGTHSVEWTDIGEDRIFVVGDPGLHDKFKKLFGKAVIFLLHGSKLEKKTNFQYRLIFFQQYYHKNAFKNRFQHFVKSVFVSLKPNVLTRLHPNQGLAERLIYLFLSQIGLVEISTRSFLDDIERCRYAVSFTSSAINEFRLMTGRKARFLRSNHVKSDKIFT